VGLRLSVSERIRPIARTIERQTEESMPNQQTYEIITDRICSLLESGVVPWRVPWSTSNVRHCNVQYRKPYRGVNALMTWATAHVRGYSSPYWLTFKQALALGGNVRRGEKSVPIIYTSAVTKTERDDAGDEIERQIRFVKYFNVFNVAQCDGLPFDASELVPELTLFATSPIDECERVIASMPSRPTIQHVEQSAWYRISNDLVNLPAFASFEKSTDYYATAFHELVHSTRHSSRLDRRDSSETSDTGRAFGCASYAREELVAEIGAAFLCCVAGIEQPTIEQSASYVAHWLSALRNDPRMIVSAAAHAQRAADFITRASESEVSSVVA
jgi:antirestriction protein ArdC